MTQRIAWLLGFCLALALALAPRVAQANREAAKQHFGAGEAKFKAGDYRGAISEFTAADALMPSPILAFNIALCHEKLGEDAMAVTLYRDYLGRLPDAKNRATVEARIADLEARIAARKATPPPPEPTPPDGGGAVAPDLDQLDPAPQPQAEPAPTGRAYDEPLARRVPRRGAVAAEGPTGTVAAAPTYPEASGAPEARPPVPEQPKPAKSTPVYKQWWFWVVVGVSAIILIDVASGSDSNAGTDEATSGATILRW